MLIRLLLTLRVRARDVDALLDRAAAERPASDCLLLWEVAGLGGQLGHRRPGDLAAACGLARSTVAARLAVLEEEGLITRTRESADRRAVSVQATHAGLRL